MPEFLVKASESGVLKCQRQTVKEHFNNQNKNTGGKNGEEWQRVLNNKWNRLALRRLIRPSDRPFMRPPTDHWTSADSDRGPVNRSIPSINVPWVNHLPNSCNLKYQNFISCCFARFTWISPKTFTCDKMMRLHCCATILRASQPGFSHISTYVIKDKYNTVCTTDVSQTAPVLSDDLRLYQEQHVICARLDTADAWWATTPRSDRSSPGLHE